MQTGVLGRGSADMAENALKTNKNKKKKTTDRNNNINIEGKTCLH